MAIARPILKPVSKDKFELCEPYEITLNAYETAQKLTIPSGYKTNGANIPRIFWSLFPPNSPEYLSAVLVHDYLCDAENYALADETLKDMMIELNVSKIKTYIFYFACKIYHKVRYGVKN